MLENIALIGLSHKTSPVEIRERLSVREQAMADVLKWVISLGAEEAVVLSTCNRVEIYWSGNDFQKVVSGIREGWEEKAGQSLENQSYIFQGRQAALHIFRVASGLDSMVLGEGQILGQVKSAYQMSLNSRMTGRNLNRLFQAALNTGKVVRSQTSIASGISSVAAAAVVLAERVFGGLERCRVMVLGAGKMAEAAAKHLSSKKVMAIFVSNRTYERAVELASSLGAEALHWEEGMERMKEADIILSSTSCPGFVLTRERISNLMKKRRGRSLFLIDIAVPRDVEPSAGNIDQVYLYDIDDLRQIVEERVVEKMREAEKAEAIVRERLFLLDRLPQIQPEPSLGFRHEVSPHAR